MGQRSATALERWGDVGHFRLIGMFGVLDDKDQNVGIHVGFLGENLVAEYGRLCGGCNAQQRPSGGDEVLGHSGRKKPVLVCHENAFMWSFEVGCADLVHRGMRETPRLEILIFLLASQTHFGRRSSSSPYFLASRTYNAIASIYKSLFGTRGCASSLFTFSRRTMRS